MPNPTPSAIGTVTNTLDLETHVGFNPDIHQWQLLINGAPYDIRDFHQTGPVWKMLLRLPSVGDQLATTLTARGGPAGQIAAQFFVDGKILVPADPADPDPTLYTTTAVNPSTVSKTYALP
jgi:hypothetical protein